MRPPVLGGGPLSSSRSSFEIDVTDHLNALVALGEGVASFGMRQSIRNGPLGYVDGPGRAGVSTLHVVRSDAPPPVPTATTVVPIVRDSYVRGGGFADDVFATSRLLHVCNDGSEQYTRWAYPGVDVPALTGSVRRATLRLNARLSGGSDVAHEVLVVDDPWDDATLTWNSRPVPPAPSVAAFTIVDSSSAWYEIDVTAAVAARVPPGAAGSVSFVVRQVERNGPLVYVNPSNHWTTDRPELVVEHG